MLKITSLVTVYPFKDGDTYKSIWNKFISRGIYSVDNDYHIEFDCNRDEWKIYRIEPFNWED